MYKRITDTHREALTSVLGAPPDLCPLDVQLIESESLPGYQRLKLVYQVHPQEYVPAYLLIPNHLSKPAPALICHHAYNGQLGKAEVVGLAGNPEAAFGVDLVLRGYVVLAPDALGYGERLPAGLDPRENLFRELASRLLRGETLLKKIIWDLSRGIDVLETRTEVDPDRLGILGHDYGSLAAMWATAMDERLQIGAGHGGWTSMKERLRLKRPIPMELTAARLLQVADYDRILGQIAPRPFIISALQNDPSSLDVEQIYTKAQEVYEAFEIPQHLHFLQHPPDPEQAFPGTARRALYEALDHYLRN
jgi:dienelactone hydrolase